MKFRKFGKAVLSMALGAAMLLSMGTPASVSQASTVGDIVIVLDPGHGGSDSGAVRTFGKTTYCERDINQKIADACKEELEKYSGVTVYMTRTSTKEAFHGSTSEDLSWRSKFAHQVGADLFVSLHCNSGLETANGTEVYVPNMNYVKSAGTVGLAVGKSILGNLTALGLKDRGVRVRNSENGTKYPDKSLSDYYAVIRGCKLYKMPGMIVEHAFVSNESDCKNFFGSDAKIKALGVADAKAILANIELIEANRVTGESKITGWQTVNSHLVYYNSAGEIVKGFFKVSGKTYYADKYGYISHGWKNIDGDLYYFSKKGIMSTGGWMKYKKKMYYLQKDGKAAVGWFTVGASKYYFNEDGSRAVGLTKAGKKTYYFKSNGKVNTGWQTINGKKYYFKKDGAMKVGWLKKMGVQYYFNPDGTMATGWTNIGEGKYYFSKSGSRKTGWLTYKRSKYYLDPSTGQAYVNQWLKYKKHYYFFDENGAMAKSFIDIGTKRYYFNSAGMMKTKWFTLNGAKYYQTKSKGLVKNNWLTLNGKKYYFDEDCKMVTGFHIINGFNYYFNPKTGEMATKNVKVGGVTYKVASDGKIGEEVLHPIMGESEKTAAQLAAHFKKSGATYPADELKKGGAKDVDTFCKIIYEEATAEGVRAEVLYSQMMLETGYLRFGGDVKITQYNFGGLGAVGGGAGGGSFKDVRTGIRAQAQHLKAYASKDDLKNECVDGRFKYVTRGCATVVEHLGIQENPIGKGWATAERYGYRILAIMDAID